MITDHIPASDSLRLHADDLLRAADTAEQSGALIALEPDEARVLASLLQAAAMLLC